MAMVPQGLAALASMHVQIKSSSIRTFTEHLDYPGFRQPCLATLFPGQAVAQQGRLNLRLGDGGGPLIPVQLICCLRVQDADLVGVIACCH